MVVLGTVHPRAETSEAKPPTKRGETLKHTPRTLNPKTLAPGNQVHDLLSDSIVAAREVVSEHKLMGLRI